MRSTKASVQKTLDCPWWCTVRHCDVDLERFTTDNHALRCHAGLTQTFAGVPLSIGGTTEALVEVYRADDLTAGVPGRAGVVADCAGVMTPAQARRFSAMLLRAAAEADEANHGTLVPTSAELRGAGA